MAPIFLDAGILRHRLSLQQLLPNDDGFGGFEEIWREIAECAAALEPLAANQSFIANQADERVSHRITIRFRNDVASGQRFVMQGRIFRIITVYDPDETQRYLVCRTEEIQ